MHGPQRAGEGAGHDKTFHCTGDWSMKDSGLEIPFLVLNSSFHYSRSTKFQIHNNHIYWKMFWAYLNLYIEPKNSLNSSSILSYRDVPAVAIFTHEYSYGLELKLSYPCAHDVFSFIKFKAINIHKKYINIHVEWSQQVFWLVKIFLGHILTLLHISIAPFNSRQTKRITRWGLIFRK